MYVSNEPPAIIVDEVSEVTIPNPDYEWYMKGKKDTRVELELYRNQLDKLAQVIDEELSGIRQKTAELNTLLKGRAVCSNSQ